MPSKILTTLLILLLCHFKMAAQCIPTIPSEPCTGTEPLVTDNESINMGATKWYYGAATTLNSLTLNGGKLVVCGDLTIDKFYMDSGQIIINPGARFVIGGGIGSGLDLKGKCEIYNFGTLECQRNLSLVGGWATPSKPNIIMNIGLASVFRMPNQYFVINNPNSWFVNQGTAQFWGIITDLQAAPSSVCLGIRSVTQMAVLINKVANSYTVSVGSACVYVFQFSQHFGPLTSIHNLFVCLSAGHTSDTGCIPFGCTPNNWGAAQVFTSCSGCAALATLPSGFSSFTLSEYNGKNQLNWGMDREAGTCRFYIEHSGDGYHFSTLDSLDGTTGRSYSYTDRSASLPIHYYRIRCVDRNSGQSIVSKTISSTDKQTKMEIYPSPFEESFFVRFSGNELLQRVRLTAADGKNIPVSIRQEGYRWRITPLSALSKNEIVFVQVFSNYRVGEATVLHR